MAFLDKICLVIIVELQLQGEASDIFALTMCKYSINY